MTLKKFLPPETAHQTRIIGFFNHILGGLECSTLWSSPQSCKLGSGGKALGDVFRYLFDSPRGTLALWSASSVAPLIFYSERCLCLCMMDVSVTQVNGRKFPPAFKCVAFLVLSKNTLFFSKNILEAFGMKSTEWWPLTELEALRSGLIGKNPFLFLSSCLYSLHTIRKQLSSSSSYFF